MYRLTSKSKEFIKIKFLFILQKIESSTTILILQNSHKVITHSNHSKLTFKIFLSFFLFN